MEPLTYSSGISQKWPSETNQVNLFTNQLYVHLKKIWYCGMVVCYRINPDPYAKAQGSVYHYCVQRFSYSEVLFAVFAFAQYLK